LQAQEIKDKLNSLISAADPIDPSLARRLDEINRWVKDVKPGSLTAKKFVMAFFAAAYPRFSGLAGSSISTFGKRTASRV